MKVGVYPAAVTPFDAKGAIDFAALVRLLAWYKAGGCQGVVLAGTNGEGPSLSAAEKRDFVKTSVALSDGLEVILGVATPSLTEAQWLCKQAHAGGASTVLLMPPSYFQSASVDGISQWFEAVLDVSPVPILIYNFPQRTGISISAAQMARLSSHENMLGLKDSSGQAENIVDYADALAGKGKKMYVGDETLLIRALSNGWSGTISGSANLVPGWLSQIVAEWFTDPDSAEAKFELILPVLRSIRKSPQPAANKRILEMLGVLPSCAPRLPLEEATLAQVQDAFELVQSISF